MSERVELRAEPERFEPMRPRSCARKRAAGRAHATAPPTKAQAEEKADLSMSNEDRIGLRAERLRVLLASMGEEPTMNSLDTFSSGIRPGGWREYLEGLEYEHVARDLDLACELSNLARELRARQWDALERFGALIASGEGATPTEKYGSLPKAEIVAATRAMLELGWGYAPPGEDGDGGEPDEE